jgi:tetratricopeptide (TPR) repeat protein
VNRIIEKISVVIFTVVYILVSSQAGSAQNPAHSSKTSLSPKQKAEFLLNRKQYDEALNAYKLLLKESHEDSTLFRGMVRAYKGAKRLEEAEAFIKEYLSSHSGSSAGQYGLGYYYYLREDDPSAQENFEKAIRSNEENALAWNNLGASLSRTKSYTFAVEKVKQAIQRDPSNPMFYNNLRMIYRDMGEAGLFFADYRQYVRDGPKLLAQGYGRVIAKTLRQEAFKYFSEGNFDGTVKKFSEAAEIYKEIDHQPGVVATYFGLGILYEESGDAAMAQKYFQKVLLINPNHLQAREKVK